MLDTGSDHGAAQRDVDAAERFDVEFIRIKRRQNAAFLLDRLEDYALFPRLHEKDCPLFVPILIPNGKRDILRKLLIDQEIYCPVHWSVSDLHELTDQTSRLYSEELSLVCDQHYDLADMERLCAAVLDFLT